MFRFQGLHVELSATSEGLGGVSFLDVEFDAFCAGFGSSFVPILMSLNPEPGK